MTREEQTPRLYEYLARTQGVIGWLPRPRWEEFRATTSVAMPVNIAVTPLRRVAESSHFLGAVAFADSSVSGLINVYRLDPKDHPYVVNVDSYFADLACANRSELTLWVNNASTSLDFNWRNFLVENVPLFKMKPDPERHWRLSVPISVLSAWDKSYSST
jgi:hypothetical protein